MQLHKHLLIFLCILFFSGQLMAQITGRLALSEDQTTYEFYITPDFDQVPPLSITNNAQISLVAPDGGLEIINFQSITGVWNGDAVLINSPSENPGFSYVSIPLSSPIQDFSYVAGVEILLFTFQNGAECLGPIRVVENDVDPFFPPNSQSVNIGNLVTILGRGARNSYETTSQPAAPCPGEELEEEMEEEGGMEEEEMEEDTEEEEEMEEDTEEEEMEEDVTEEGNDPEEETATPATDQATICSPEPTGTFDIFLNPSTTGTPPYSLVWTNTTTQTKDSTTIQEVFSQYTIENLAPGDYVAVVTDANGRSFSEEGNIPDNTYLLNPVLAITDASCGEDNGSITINYPDGSRGDLSYAWSNGMSTQDVDALEADVSYTVTVTDNNGCTSVRVAEINSNEGINAEITPTNISCNGTNDGSLSSNLSNPENYSYLWQGNGVNSTASSLTDLAPGEYTVTISDPNGACDLTQTVFITEPEELTVEAAVEATELCDVTEEGIIRIQEVVNGQGALQFSIDGGEFSQQRQFTVPTGDSYTITASDENGCTASTIVEVSEGSGLSLDLPSQTILELGDEMELDVNYSATSTVNFQWEEDPSLSCTDCPNPTINPTQTTTYTLIASDDNGCSKEATIIVFLSKTDKIYVPNAFSPNNDGINDSFKIFIGSNIASVNSLQIYNRWGDQVFQSLSNDAITDIGWNGQYNGRVASTGVYVFFADVTLIDGTSEIISGDISLMR